MRTPIISVIMPVFNGELYLNVAIESILNQTINDFEFIIIDDGSFDNTPSIINSFKDPRIIRIKHNTNLGLVRSLNDGIAHARGEFIARMDADDISMPNRFEKQLEFLQQNPDVGVVGGFMQVIDKEGTILKTLKFQTTDKLIRWKICFENQIPHPTAMFRLDKFRLVGGYRDFKASEDYDLWQRMSEITHLANIDQIVLKYRVHGKNISYQPNENRIVERRDIQQRAISQIIGIKETINWHAYWNDPFYAGNVILKIYKNIYNQLAHIEKRTLKRQVGLSLFEKAESLPANNFYHKTILWFYSFLIYPKLLWKYTRKHLIKMDDN